jgi:hypothetical protein
LFLICLYYVNFRYFYPILHHVIIHHAALVFKRGVGVLRNISRGGWRGEPPCFFSGMPKKRTILPLRALYPG